MKLLFLDAILLSFWPLSPPLSPTVTSSEKQRGEWEEPPPLSWWECERHPPEGGGRAETCLAGLRESFLASAQCSDTTANSVTWHINSSADCRPYRERRPRTPAALSSSLCNTLDATDKGRGGERVCRMWRENRAQWYIVDEYFKGSSVVWRGRKMKTQEDLKGIGTPGRTLRLWAHSALGLSIFQRENVNFVVKLEHLLHQKMRHLW